MSKLRALVIEDEHDLADILSYNLDREGFEVVVAHDGSEGLRKAQSLTPHIVLLDLMLPELSGLEVCRALRADPKTRSVPILMLTAKGEETDQIVGFALGADDYVTKPFSVKVLTQRIKALRRRYDEDASQAEVVERGILRLDHSKHRAFVKNVAVDLTPTEFRLLSCLMRQPGRAFSRRDLMEAAIGDRVMVLERTIDVHTKSLRRKLGPAGDLVETVRSVGYRFRE